MTELTHAIGLILIGILTAMIYEWIVLPIIDGRLSAHIEKFRLWWHYKKTGIKVTKKIKNQLNKPTE